MKKTNWEKIFKLGDKINKDLKLTESEVLNLSVGTITKNSTVWVIKPTELKNYLSLFPLKQKKT